MGGLIDVGLLVSRRVRKKVACQKPERGQAMLQKRDAFIYRTVSPNRKNLAQLARAQFEGTCPLIKVRFTTAKLSTSRLCCLSCFRIRRRARRAGSFVFPAEHS